MLGPGPIERDKYMQATMTLFMLNGTCAYNCHCREAKDIDKKLDTEQQQQLPVADPK